MQMDSSPVSCTLRFVNTCHLHCSLSLLVCFQCVCVCVFVCDRSNVPCLGTTRLSVSPRNRLSGCTRASSPAPLNRCVSLLLHTMATKSRCFVWMFIWLTFWDMITCIHMFGFGCVWCVCRWWSGCVCGCSSRCVSWKAARKERMCRQPDRSSKKPGTRELWGDHILIFICVCVCVSVWSCVCSCLIVRTGTDFYSTECGHFLDSVYTHQSQPISSKQFLYWSTGQLAHIFTIIPQMW